MPEISPRRSARARTSQSTPNLQHSSTSNSSSSAKQDRNTRANARGDSNGHSDIVQSPSSMASDAGQPSELETRQTRQRKREQNNNLPSSQNGNDNNDDGADEAEDDDVTRCVCGHSEYPGPPSSAVEPSKGHHGRDNKNASSYATADGAADEAGGLFIQCDECHVWQHGGCVGIMDEAKCPDQYYCDQCKPALHKIQSAAKGRKYSLYKPVTDTFTVPQPPPQRKHSAAKEPERRPSKDSDRKAGSKTTPQAPGKRRSTMNSRAAWDDEELSRYLEGTSGNTATSEPSTGSRKGKRAREGSEEAPTAKRRKAGSPLSSGPEPDASPEAESDERSNSKGKAKDGGPAAPEDHATSRPKREDRRRERDREQDRADTTNRRKGRTDRRRVDDIEPEEGQKPSKNAATAPKSGRQPANNNTTGPNPSPAVSSSNKKGGKAAPRRGKVGRNQYTKERELAAMNKGDATRPSHSRDGEELHNGGPDGSGPALSNGSKPSRPKHLSFNRTSLNEIRKRVAGIGEFISRTQVELAGERTPPSGNSPPSGTSKSNPQPKPTASNGASKLNNEIHEGNDKADASPEMQDAGDGKEGDGNEDVKGKETAENTTQPDKETFRKMTSTEMMDVISREITLWQKVYGKWGEKPAS